jgi:ankyrin repeat protein
MEPNKDVWDVTPEALEWAKTARDSTTGEPVMCAIARMNAPELARVRIEAGADVHARNSQGKTPLHIAVECNAGSGLVGQLLMANPYDVNTRDMYGRTPMFYARSRIVEAMLGVSGTDVHVRDNDGMTPLHYVMSTGRAFAVEMLLIKDDSDMCVRDNFGRTPLECATTAADRDHLIARAEARRAW